MSENPKKIVFVIPSLVGGGAERVLTLIVKHLDRRKYDIYIVLFEKKGVLLPYLPRYVKIYDLNKKNRFSLPKLIFGLNQLFRKINPNTVVSFLAYSNAVTILAKLLSFNRFNLIISIRNNLSEELSDAKYGRLKNLLYKRIFRCANYILVPSSELKNRLATFLQQPPGRIKVIPNPIDLDEINILKKQQIRELPFDKYVLSMGRLTRQKGFHYLIKAYSLIRDKTNAKMLIIGDGEEKETLNKLTIRINIPDRVFFLGFQENPYKFMKHATLFVLSSLYEGFPNVVLEAMACGVPVISTDCHYGPSEIITNGKNGILVPRGSEGALSEAIFNLLKDKDLRKKLSVEGMRRAEDFGIEKVLRQYEEFF